MALLSRQETIDYHRSKLQNTSGMSESDIEYHTKGTEIFNESVPFDENFGTRFANTLKKLLGKTVTVDELRKNHEEFYENEKTLT